MKNMIKNFWNVNKNTIVAFIICACVCIAGIHLVREIGDWTSTVIGMLMIGVSLAGIPIFMIISVDKETEDEEVIIVLVEEEEL